MAIQGTSNFQYNNVTYDNPYFRLNFLTSPKPQSNLVHCYMFHSQTDENSGVEPITCLHLTISNANAPSVSEYELYVNQQITGSLKNISPGSTFDIIGINA